MQQNLKLNPHGVVGFLFITIMFGIAFALKWNINWWYFVIALVLYSVAVLFLTGREEATRQTTQTTGYGLSSHPPSSKTDEKKLILDQCYIFRWLLGCHFALMFLGVGLLIHFPNSSFMDLSPFGSLDARSSYFIASVIGGLALPFLLLRVVEGKNRVNLHGIIGIALITLMFGIALLYDWNIYWGYFILAIALYSGAIIFLNLVEDIPGEGPPPKLFRPRLGCHLAFVLLVVGLGLHFQNMGINFGFFVAGVAGGLVIPYLLFRESTS